MKRKVLSVILVLIMLSGMAPQAWAQGEAAKISQEQALKIARDTFGISENLTNVETGYREEDYQVSRKIWEFRWDLSRYGKYHSIRVEVDADTGDILSYWDEKEWDPKGKPKAKLKSKEECKKIAESFIQKLIPEKAREIREKVVPYPDYLAWGYGPRTYSFTYERQVNGVPFPENSINVAVSAETGKIAHYYAYWDNSWKFPSPDNVIAVEQAEKIFREKIGLRLGYIQPFGPYPPGLKANKKPVRLYYTLEDLYGPARVIDALDGRVIDQTGKEVNVQAKVYLPVREEPPKQNNDKALTLEETKARVSDYITVPQGYKLQSSRYYEGWGGSPQKVWEFQFGPSDYRGGEPFNVTISAVTGELVNYNRWVGPWEEGKDRQINYDYDRCQQIARDFLKRVAPQKAEYVYLPENALTKQTVVYYNGKAATPPTYNFNFVRIVNGIPYNNNSINVEVDNNTGEIRGFWLNWEQNLEFVSPDSVITEQEAVDALLAKEKPRLVYTRKLSEDDRPSQDIMLVYALFKEAPQLVEAKTGKVTNYFELQNPVRLDDIQGHWAEREIRTLASWGIVSGSSNRFYPDKPVTRAEFVTMLAAAKGLQADAAGAQNFTDVSPSAWYYSSVQAAVKAGVAKGSGGKFEPEKILTKQEAVVMLIKAFNGDTQPEMAEESLEQYKDQGEIAPWAKNAVIQAVEMGIITGSDGCLKPTAPTTRAETAVMLLRTLEYSQNDGYGRKIIYG